MLNSDFDHMFGLANGFCDQKPERSEMNWPNINFLVKSNFIG